ncbi:ArsR family transcriptional regulator [Halonotius roseus]|uniref:ArsR family transcriptional regulator n=1 Tax=Halonotius roseus TaxID=2511997 RepID=A0A544QMI8_9EURY|nr:ArsR family transcriptional regulator [Halonotius roseus]
MLIPISSVSRIRVIEAFTRNASRRLSTDDIARLSDTKPSVARSQTQRLSELGIIEAVDGEENTFELNSDDEIGQLLRQLEGVVLKRLLEGEE